MTQPTSVEQVVNEALDRIGFPEYIGNIYEGTKQARIALDLYGQVRSSLLRGGDWQFAEVIASAVLSGQSAPFPWTVEYTYPATCLKLRNLFNATYQTDPNNPLPIHWTIANNPNIPGKVIWTGAASATLVYTQDVTDPGQWEPLFADLVIGELGKRMALQLMRPNGIEVLADEEKSLIPLARGTIG